jgi:hypothetical protein
MRMKADIESWVAGGGACGHYARSDAIERRLGHPLFARRHPLFLFSETCS